MAETSAERANLPANLGNNMFDSAAQVCHDSSRRLWSLWDMLRFHAADFISARDYLDFVQVKFSSRPRDETAGRTAREELHYALDRLERHCRILELDSAVAKILRIKVVALMEHRSTHADIAHMCADVRERIEEQLHSRMLMYVPNRQAEYYCEDNELPKLFGEKACAAFPAAVSDMRLAVNCYAANLSTACVFHLMRVAELGLRSLAKDRRCTFPADIELQEWLNIIEKIESSIRQIDAWPKSRSKAAALEFYWGAVGEFRAFKDAWRNHVMHARVTYDEHQALSALRHVSEFVKRLSAKLSEARRTPLRWR